MTELLRRLYGARVAHLVLLLAAFALTGYTVAVLGIANLFTAGVWWQSIAVWFAVAIIAHDLLLFPLYAAADRLLPTSRRSPAGHRGDDQAHPSGRPALTNYVRMPTLAAGLLLIVFLPGIIEQGAIAFTQATGLTQAPYLTRWLLLTAAFYLLSAFCYGVKAFLRHRDFDEADGVGAAASTGQ